jgi:hypothetical protein
MAGVAEFERAAILEEAARPEEAIELLSAIGKLDGVEERVRSRWVIPGEF